MYFLFLNLTVDNILLLNICDYFYKLLLHCDSVTFSKIE